MRPVVVVLGMHRSGTSLCARMLDGLGVDMAEAAGASPANEGGHFERPRINDFHDEVLRLFDRGWRHPTHHLALPDGWWADPRVAEVRTRMVAYLSPLLAASAKMGFKDPRTSRLLPMWPEILATLRAEPAYVFCVRDPAQVARSVSARDQLAPDQAVYRWLVYNAQAVAGVGGAPVCVVPYEAWFTAPEATLTRLAAFVGVTARPELLGIVSDRLRHDALGAAEPVPALAAELHRRIAAARETLDVRLLELAGDILGCEMAVMPFLRDAALLPLSIGEQNRIIADLQGMVERLRAG